MTTNQHLTDNNGRHTGITMTGTAVYPRLVTPDTKYNELGVYQADIRVPFEEAKGLMAELAAVFKQWTGKAPAKADNTMWKMVLDDDGNETGEVLFKFRVKNFMSKQTGELVQRNPKLFFEKGVEKSDKIGGGTQMKVQFQVYCWTATSKGVSLQPMSVLIQELREYEGGSGGNPFGVGEAVAFDNHKEQETKLNNGPDTEAEEHPFY